MAAPVIRAAAAALLLATRFADAQCVADATGASFSNATDPACLSQAFEFTESDASGSNLALGYPVPQPVASLTGVDGFRSYASLFARHQDLMTMNGAVSGTIVGQTRSGNAIWAYVLGDPDQLKADGTREAATMINGGIHAREWQSPEAVSETLEQLAAMSADGGLGQYLSENLTQVIVPVLNIDGFLQTQAWPSSVSGSPSQPRDGRMRRKNLHHASRGSPVDMDVTTPGDNFHGVDLNRNSVHGFGLNNSSSTDVFSLIYRGTVAASEPETAALQAAAALGPADRLRLYTDVHSFSRIFFTQLTANARRDAITVGLMNKLRAVTDFRYRDGSTNPLPRGTGGIGLTADYFAYEYEIPSWTLETEPLNSGADYGGTGISHSGFVLPDSEVRRMREEVASMLVLGAYTQAGPPAVAASAIYSGPCPATVDPVSAGVPLYAAHWETAAAGTSRILSVSHNEPLTPGLEYCLWLAFDKPMRVRDSAGNIVNYAGQNVSLFPLIQLTAPTLGNAGLSSTLSAGAWQHQPLPAPGASLRYADDALMASFSLPASWDITQATPLVLQITAADFAQQQLDADPSTPVDWAGGHWTGYEQSDGRAGDVGGSDCSFKPFAAPAGMAATAPLDAVQCPAAKPATPVTPAPPRQPAASSGGGGAVSTALLAAMALARRRRRPR